MRVRNLESRSVDGHLAAMHFCFLPVQDSPVSLPPLVPSSPPSSPSKPCILSLHLPAQPLARHSFCITLLSPPLPLPFSLRLPFSSSVLEHRRWCSPSVRPICLLPQIACQRECRQPSTQLLSSSTRSCLLLVRGARQTRNWPGNFTSTTKSLYLHT